MSFPVCLTISRSAATAGSRPSSAMPTTPPIATCSQRTAGRMGRGVELGVHAQPRPPDPRARPRRRATLSKVHRAYAGLIHARAKRTGHFWQGRFGCVAMDEPHLLAALRYVALNPVRARLVERAEDWGWSSTHALLDPRRGDGMTDTAPVLWSAFPTLPNCWGGARAQLCRRPCASLRARAARSGRVHFWRELKPFSDGTPGRANADRNRRGRAN